MWSRFGIFPLWCWYLKTNFGNFRQIAPKNDSKKEKALLYCICIYLHIKFDIRLLLSILYSIFSKKATITAPLVLRILSCLVAFGNGAHLVPGRPLPCFLSAPVCSDSEHLLPFFFTFPPVQRIRICALPILRSLLVYSFGHVSSKYLQVLQYWNMFKISGL
jgi:hypothetical protein